MVDAITSQYRSNHLSFANLALETKVATRTVDIARPLAVARVRGIKFGVSSFAKEKPAGLGVSGACLEVGLPILGAESRASICFEFSDV